jgi:lipopolysaccharide/colanic/teichoic acid biosynthesis glycosyltransferase
MRIVIAGASGFVGRMLVPLLQAQGADLVLLGRDAGRLAAIFPDYVTATYEALPNCAAGADLFLNLAVVNNDQSSGLETMLLVNATLAATLAAAATRAGVGRFVNVSSIHALDPNDNRPYAVSKRTGQAAVDAASDGMAMHLFLPAVVGTRFAGALAVFNLLPRPVSRALLGPLSALKPILPVADLAHWIMVDALAAPRQVILTKGQMGNLSYSAASRSLDLAAAVVGLVALSPVLITTWGLIRSQGDGPAIFAQDRIGRHGRVFTCYKFRTMAMGTVQAGTHEVSASAVTPLGKRLRRWKIDELPQLWNVLTGEMGLIGPRPCLPSQQELVQRRAEAGILDVRPGISGLAQVAGIDMSDPARLVDWDARYVAIRGLILDLGLILRTLRGGGQGDRVAG